MSLSLDQPWPLQFPVTEASYGVARIPLVQTTAEIAAFRLEAYSWVRTPFRPRACVKGAAVDCVNYPRAVLRACGARLLGAYPEYEVDRSKHVKESLILQWFGEHLDELGQVAGKGDWQEHARPGDAVVFQLNNCADHLGLIVNPAGGLFLNAVFPQGVINGHLTDSTWAERIHSIWRVYRQ